MKENVVIIVSCGTNNPNRATRAIHLATVAHKEGKNVTLFLLDEAVYLAREGLLDHLRAATGDIADDLMTYLQAHEVPILACTPCANARRVKEEELIEGVEEIACQILELEGMVGGLFNQVIDGGIFTRSNRVVKQAEQPAQNARILVP